MRLLIGQKLTLWIQRSFFFVDYVTDLIKQKEKKFTCLYNENRKNKKNSFNQFETY